MNRRQWIIIILKKVVDCQKNKQKTLKYIQNSSRHHSQGLSSEIRSLKKHYYHQFSMKTRLFTTDHITLVSTLKLLEVLDITIVKNMSN